VLGDPVIEALLHEQVVQAQQHPPCQEEKGGIGERRAKLGEPDIIEALVGSGYRIWV
jgi:hypothetical protein